MSLSDTVIAFLPAGVAVFGDENDYSRLDVAGIGIFTVDANASGDAETETIAGKIEGRKKEFEHGSLDIIRAVGIFDIEPDHAVLSQERPKLKKTNFMTVADRSMS